MLTLWAKKSTCGIIEGNMEDAVKEVNPDDLWDDPSTLVKIANCMDIKSLVNLSIAAIACHVIQKDAVNTGHLIGQ